MPSALKQGRPIRFRPGVLGSKKPPECAGLYYIYDNAGNMLYIGQAVNLRRRVYEHKRNRKIPEGGFVDCFKAKEGITYQDLDATEKAKIEKYAPPLNQRQGGGGKKSSKLAGNTSTEPVSETTVSLEQDSDQRKAFLYKFLGYAKVDKFGTVRYKKEPKAAFFMVVELIVKMLLVASSLLAALGIYLKYSKGVVFNQYAIISMIIIPVFCYTVFHYIRRNKVFIIITVFSLIASIALYLFSYPFHIEWPF